MDQRHCDHGNQYFYPVLCNVVFPLNPAREVLEKRRKRIAGDLETAKTSREDALALKAEYEDKIKSIDKEAQEILDAARKKAKKQEADILSEAREEANRIVDRANREIELEKKKALEDMKTEIVPIASLMAERGSCRFHGCEASGFPDRGDFKGNG